ncbi:uncharacterized protein LOC135213259 [Macrobrachium nipponense]|uniref:uncharacterized protein LOC135213259 n=1 Tax=Macrobrachium nipponense TaxID=159736 RepID=UPI0030C864CB
MKRRINLFIGVLSMAVICLLVTAGTTTPRVRCIFVSEEDIPDRHGIADSMVQSNGLLTRETVLDALLQKRKNSQSGIADSAKSAAGHRNITKREIESPENWNKENKTVEFKDLPREDAVTVEDESTILNQSPSDLDPDRFKFIYRRERISKNGAKINLIPEKLRWRHSPERHNVCNSTDPLILAIVVSSVANLQRREYIRRTWGSPRLYPYTRIRCVFIIGLTTDADLQEAIDREYDEHGDLVQYNYVDLYE